MFKNQWMFKNLREMKRDTLIHLRCACRLTSNGSHWPQHLDGTPFQISLQDNRNCAIIWNLILRFACLQSMWIWIVFINVSSVPTKHSFNIFEHKGNIVCDIVSSQSARYISTDKLSPGVRLEHYRDSCVQNLQLAQVLVQFQAKSVHLKSLGQDSRGPSVLLPIQHW